MADAIGPCATLPGCRHKVPTGAVCDVHPDVLAEFAIQGETDSFGAEIYHMCKACYDEYSATPDTVDTCEWCGKTDATVKPRRDPDEGPAGPVYHVCSDCNLIW